MKNLTLLKLGGSLITDKSRPHTIREETIVRIAQEIVLARQAAPDLTLIIGHGSGSFGHVPAQQFNTRNGVYSKNGWEGFAKVWHEARALNQIIVDILVSAGLPIIAFPPSATTISIAGNIIEWNTTPLQMALSHQLIPLINGDVIFDQQLGGTILSTEELFIFLAKNLQAERIIITGIEEGVWEDYPTRTELIEKITPSGFQKIKHILGKSSSTDVTGGMEKKVESLLSLIITSPGIKAQICSGNEPGTLEQALLGKFTGTLICADQVGKQL